MHLVLNCRKALHICLIYRRRAVAGVARDLLLLGLLVLRRVVSSAERAEENNIYICIHMLQHCLDGLMRFLPSIHEFWCTCGTGSQCFF